MQSAVLGQGGTTEPVEHQLDHGNLNHGFAVFDELLIVFAEPAIVAEPGERAFDDPALAENFKTDLLAKLVDDFQNPATPAV